MNIATFTTGWNFMRILRLVFGILFAYQAFQHNDKIMGFFSAIFLFQAISNTGCCGTAGCSVSQPITKNENIEEAVFEEVKTNKQ